MEGSLLLKYTINVKWSSFKAKNDVFQDDFPIGIVGWLSGNKAVLINSRNDIWMIEPNNKQKPINLTSGQGANKIFCLAIDSKDEYIQSKNILIKAFDLETKDAGFYGLNIGKEISFLKLSMEQYVYDTNGVRHYSTLSNIDLAKSENLNAFVIRRQDARNSPNYYFTRDFISFKKISAIHPEREYNWMTTELHTFQLPKGIKAQGVLYKPEDFNPEKRYPIVFYFYERLSDELNAFKMPSTYGSAAIVIPYFVSNGYLVFTPDMVVDSLVGESALISIETAAKHLIRYPWVDSTHMGISGHSFGGYEASYIATHSKLFSAVVSGAGVVNLVSFHGGIFDGNVFDKGKRSRQGMVENGYFRMKTSFWNDLSRYIEESPIFSVDKVITPVLLMHNKQDEAVSFSQSVEFFLALRRLGKKVWLLQYEGENHVNRTPKAKLDITIRIKQFFDHYLKGASPPVWMTKGIPSQLKGLENHLDLNNTDAKH